MAILVWDFDNTLAYRDGMWTRSLYHVLKRNGYNHISEDDLRPHFQKGFPWHRHSESHADYFEGRTWWEYTNTIIKQALLVNGIVDAKATELTNQMKDEYLDIQKWCLFDDTIRNLEEAIQRGHSNYILSNHVPELNQLVQGLGIDQYFTKVISSAEVGYEKPNCMIFNSLLNGVDKESAIYMIGDSYSADVIGALNCGLFAILVRQANPSNYQAYSIDLDGIWKYIH